jgi:hypothetical protein
MDSCGVKLSLMSAISPLRTTRSSRLNRRVRASGVTSMSSGSLPSVNAETAAVPSGRLKVAMVLLEKWEHSFTRQPHAMPGGVRPVVPGDDAPFRTVNRERSSRWNAVALLLVYAARIRYRALIPNRPMTSPITSRVTSSCAMLSMVRPHGRRSNASCVTMRAAVKPAQTMTAVSSVFARNSPW